MGKYRVFTVVIICAIIFFGYMYGAYLWEKIVFFFNLLADRQQIKTFVDSYGTGAPFIFIIFQILQVLFAPIPGEATGFIGGYLFGATRGFLYSSIGLSVGSCIIFFIGRFLGKRYIRKLIPKNHIKRLDNIVRPQGIMVLIILFVFPGFPKDYLCLFLGVSTIPFKAFIILASIGRMPGTFMLSIQGALLFEKTYRLFALTLGLCLLLILLAYRYRNNIYKWIENINKKDKHI